MNLNSLKEKKKGKLFILSAPAGAGKTTLVKMVTKELSTTISSISYTTRAPRPGEINGKDYYFVSKQEFERQIQLADFLEHVKLFNHYYGTSKKWVNHHLDSGKSVILVIDTQGFFQLKEKIETISIFILPPSLQELRRRLETRGTEKPEMIVTFTSGFV